MKVESRGHGVTKVEILRELFFGHCHVAVGCLHRRESSGPALAEAFGVSNCALLRLISGSLIIKTLAAKW